MNPVIHLHYEGIHFYCEGIHLYYEGIQTQMNLLRRDNFEGIHPEGILSEGISSHNQKFNVE